MSQSQPEIKQIVSYHTDTSFNEKRYKDSWRQAEIKNARDLAVIMQKYAWGAVVWNDGTRNGRSGGFSDWFGLDFDSPDMTLAEATKLFCDMQHVIGLTKSHQIEKVEKDGSITAPGDRFRIALRWTSRIENKRDYEYNLERLIKKHGADKACKNWSRLFWPCTKIVAGSIEGYTEDWVTAPPPIIRVTQGPQPDHKAFPISLQNKIIKAIEAPPKNGRHNLMCKIAFEIGALGYSEQVALNIISSSPLREAEEDYERSVGDAWRAGSQEVKNSQADAMSDSGQGNGRPPHELAAVSSQV